MISCLALSASLDVTYLVDSLEVGGINRPSEVHRSAGGKALNVARAAATLGARVSAIAVLGGRTGELVSSMLRETPIELQLVDGGVETRSCLSIAAADSERLTEFYEPAGPVDARSWGSFAEAVRSSEISTGDWLVLAGSVPDGLPIDELCRLLRDRRETGARIAVDSHGPALVRLIEEVRPDVVKINRTEAAGVLGMDDGIPIQQLAQRVREMGPGLVVVTDGVEGACAVDGDGVVMVAPVPVPGRYPVGSGDCFLAGLVVGLERGDRLTRALELATAVATANAMVPGAGTFDPAQVELILHR